MLPGAHTDGLHRARRLDRSLIALHRGASRPCSLPALPYRLKDSCIAKLKEFIVLQAPGQPGLAIGGGAV